MFKKMSLLNIKLKTKVSIFISLLLIVFAAVFLFYSLYQVDHLLGNINEKKLRLVGKAINHSRETKLKAVMDTIANFDEFNELFFKRDRDALQKFLYPMFLKIKKQFGISGMHLVFPDHRTFLRV
ncbi:MAG: hypothetical protein OEZ36_08440, partial [Spirochaetota bacterium]|nr:hypothetical protein [Spirochaetota bacterium]